MTDLTDRLRGPGPLMRVERDVIAAELDRLAGENKRLREALQGLYDDQVDYLALNHLGGMDNHWMVRARAALASHDSKESKK